MYVCICNAISDRKARSHDAASVADFYRMHGVRAKCGKCVRVVREMLDAEASAGEARPDSCGAEV